MHVFPAANDDCHHSYGFVHGIIKPVWRYGNLLAGEMISQWRKELKIRYRSGNIKSFHISYWVARIKSLQAG